MAQQLSNLTLIPGLATCVRIQHCCGLWCRLAAVSLIGPLAWKPPYAAGVALKRQKKKRKRKRKRNPEEHVFENEELEENFREKKIVYLELTFSKSLTLRF